MIQVYEGDGIEPPERKQLRDLYGLTRWLVKQPLEIGGYNVEEWLPAVFDKPMVAVTAWNPNSIRVSEAENIHANSILQVRLHRIRHDLAWQPICCRGENGVNWYEDGWFIPDCRNQILSILEDFNQKAAMLFSPQQGDPTITDRFILWRDGTVEVL